MNSALAITEADRTAFAAVSKSIDYDAVEDLHFLGNYKRQLPVNMARMMENAHDWEHLPFVHPSAFAAIEHIDSGKWGWRTKVALPTTGEIQHLQLLVDNDRNYWATTVLSGSGQGVHIHTQAKPVSDQAITVDVRFYAEEKPASDEMTAMSLAYLQSLYAQLYDEDQALMEGRQSALDNRTDKVSKESLSQESQEIDLGLSSELATELPHVFHLRGAQYCLNRYNGKWIAYGATCPHLLGPLAQAEIFADGSIACPWHGYRFDSQSGRNLDGKCRDLPAPPLIEEQAGRLIALFPLANS